MLLKCGEKRTLWKNLKRTAQIIWHTLRDGEFLRDILEGQVGKIRERERPRLEYFAHIMFKNMGCRTFREGKELACDK